MSDPKIKKVLATYKFKRAAFDFKIEQTWTAGIQLLGWEVKALKAYQGDINGAFCKFNEKGNRLTMIGSKISPLQGHGDSINVCEELRSRNLLLNSSELKKIRAGMLKGVTCIPLRLYATETNMWKVEIALATGMKKWDKREQIKQKDITRASKRTES